MPYYEDMYTEASHIIGEGRWAYTLDEIIEQAKQDYIDCTPDWSDADMERIENSIRERLTGRWDIAEAQDIASALYDGGWRAVDRDQLIIERRMSAEQADQICDLLKEYEEADHK